VKFQLGNHTVEFPTFNADIPNDCLLGADFLKIFKATIDFESENVQFTLPHGIPLKLNCSGVTHLVVASFECSALPTLFTSPQGRN